MYKKLILPVLATVGVQACTNTQKPQEQTQPNIVIIYTDDVGFADVGCYGSPEVETPNIDRLAAKGVRFTNAYATASISTPSRYSLLTGEYHWRKSTDWSVGDIKGVGIAPGDAGLLIDTQAPTLPSMLQEANYATAVVGKWHLGLGPLGGPDWNTHITPGPSEVGFDYSFLVPVTGDRVPCVYVENSKVVGLDKDDPIYVSYGKPIGDPLTMYNPDVKEGQVVTYTESSKDNYKGSQPIKMHPSFGHDNTVVNGISRIGYMTGGKAAYWKDEEIAETITQKAVEFIRDNKDGRFFLYFATHDTHVPRVPGKRFAGKSGLGVYGDVIMQMDWCVGQILEELEALGLTENTIVIFSSDNGPVQNDGYFDGTDNLREKHSPTGPYSGGKYSALEGGTRVPFIVSWPGTTESGVSEVPFSHVDMFASIAALTGHQTPNQLSLDSENYLDILLGKNMKGRDVIVQQNIGGTLSIVKNNMKYIEPGDGQPYNLYTNPPTKLGNSSEPQLFDLINDVTEEINIAAEHPEKVKEFENILMDIRNKKTN